MACSVKFYTMMDQALVGALVTGVLALAGAAIAKLRCYAKVDEDGECLYGGGFTEHRLAPPSPQLETVRGRNGDLFYVKNRGDGTT